MGQSWSRWVHRQSAATIQELAPRKTPGQDNPLPRLTREVLLSALQETASYIARKGGDLEVVAVGGAVNTIHLQSRPATHDLDFFNNFLTAADYELLVRAARRTAERQAGLDEQWFNNRTVLFIPRDQRSSLTTESFQQVEVVFRQAGLTVYAAPWNYAFCCKVDRLAGSNLHSPQSYDLQDAVRYLHEFLRSRGLTQVQYSTVLGWFTQYSLRWTPANNAVMSEVNRVCRETFRANFAVVV